MNHIISMKQLYDDLNVNFKLSCNFEVNILINR